MLNVVHSIYLFINILTIWKKS